MRQRGYTLPLVILVLTTLAAAMTLMVVTLTAGAKTTGSMLGRRHTLYACDGIVRGLMVKSRDYFAETPVPTAAGLRAHLCGASTAPLCPPVNAWFPDFTIEEITTGTGGVDIVEEVPTGPFRGQMARRTDISLSVTAKKTATSQRCRVTQNAINSEIGLFQFAVFSAMRIELLQPPTMDIRGRVHVNGDFLAGGTNPLVIEKVTTAGRIHASSAGYGIRNANTDTPVQIKNTNDGTSSGWRANSETTWSGNAQDQSWGVPMLRLPVATAASTQGGKDANGIVRSNSGMLRVLVDPPRSSDDDATRAERFANKAQIRIINGVWYKNDGTFPGKPIWSDHPGSFTTSTMSVEEFALAGSVTIPIPNSSIGAKRYSHYETGGLGIIANDTTQRSVVSYGPLAVDGTSWKPGVVGGSLTAAVTDADLANGTRSGFIDRRVARALGDGIGRTLPLNFDVGAFVEALGDTDLGELGHHFPGGLGDNAIVWIANTWPDWQRGFPDDFAGQHPAEPTGQRATLPQPLCGIGGDATIAALVAKQPCSGTVGATAVRVWNARTIDPAVLPRGLSIVTNGPMYVLGDTNTGSLVAGVPGQPRTENASAPWVPFLAGGDAVTLLSNKWNDGVRLWGSGLGDYSITCAADAGDTTYVAAVLGGHLSMVGLPTSVSAAGAGGGVNNFPRFLECWSGQKAIIHGSLVAGYRSVYQDQGYSIAPGPYAPPLRTWKFDPNFAKPANQPPGAPSFFVSAVERWQRD